MPYAGFFGMLLSRYGKFTILKLKSSCHKCWSLFLPYRLQKVKTKNKKPAILNRAKLKAPSEDAGQLM